jgi:hypothetical protein
MSFLFTIRTPRRDDKASHVDKPGRCECALTSKMCQAHFRSNGFVLMMGSRKSGHGRRRRQARIRMAPWKGQDVVLRLFVRGDK